MSVYEGYLQQNEYAQPFLIRNDVAITRTLTNQSDPEQQTVDTIALMKEIIHESARHDRVRLVASMINRQAPSPYIVQKLSAIFSYIKTHVTFVPDEQVVEMGLHGSELLIKPEVLLSMVRPQGDCDDFSMLTTALILATGIDKNGVKLVTIAANLSQPKIFSHVFVRVYWWDQEFNDLRHIDVDTSHGLYLGWKAERYYRIQEWNL